MRTELLRWLAEGAPGDLRETDSVLETEQLEALAGLGYTGAATTLRGRWWEPASVDPDWEQSRWRRLFEDPEFARER